MAKKGKEGGEDITREQRVDANLADLRPIVAKLKSGQKLTSDDWSTLVFGVIALGGLGVSAGNIADLW